MAIGTANIIDNNVLSNHIITISLTDIFISVERRQGIDAEKKSTVDTLVTAITNFVTNGLSTTRRAGKNISASPVAAALDASIASGI